MLSSRRINLKLPTIQTRSVALPPVSFLVVGALVGLLMLVIAVQFAVAGISAVNAWRQPDPAETLSVEKFNSVFAGRQTREVRFEGVTSEGGVVRYGYTLLDANADVASLTPGLTSAFCAETRGVLFRGMIIEWTFMVAQAKGGPALVLRPEMCGFDGDVKAQNVRTGDAG
jgi:hypothetical protein